MDVCKNKDTGRYFIFIDQAGMDKLLLVTPDAQIKSLRAALFEDVEDVPDDLLISEGLVGKKQMEALYQYVKNRSDELVDSVTIDFEDMSPYQQAKFLQDLIEIQKRQQSK